MVDDWAERGSQALAAQHLVETTGATFLGLTILVDQMAHSTRSRLNAVTTLVTANELKPAE